LKERKTKIGKKKESRKKKPRRTNEFRKTKP
jgi:hypothetical protein